MRVLLLFLAASASLLTGCNESSGSAVAQPPFVKVATVIDASGAQALLSGTVRARVESPLAFQVSGRIAQRLADAGQTVHAGQALFELDPRDLELAVQARSADLAAAEASLAAADADLTRDRKLREQNFISAQALERAQLARQEALSRRDAAAAQLAQARNASGYGRLVATAPGVLIEVTGESGQVVAAGQPVATLAQAGAREVEVYFPEDTTPPQSGEAFLADGHSVPLKLRETSGAVEPQGRTRRARYTVANGAEALVLGTVVRTRFAGSDKKQSGLSVPIGALDERGEGARVWRINNGHVAPVPVTVLAVDSERASIAGNVASGDRVVALGTHLLTDNMAVQELAK